MGTYFGSGTLFMARRAAKRPGQTTRRRGLKNRMAILRRMRPAPVKFRKIGTLSKFTFDMGPALN